MAAHKLGYLVCADRRGFSLRCCFDPQSTFFFYLFHHKFSLFISKKLLTGKIKRVKKQIELLERSRRKRDISLSPLKKIQQPLRAKKKSPVATSTPKAKQHKFVESLETDSSDCELIEQSSDLIVLEDDSDSDTFDSDSNLREVNSSNSDPVQQPAEVDAKQAVVDDSSCMFYEDREPNTNYSVPLYDSVQCTLIDSSVETFESESQPNHTEMSTIRNNFGNRNDGRTMSIKDSLGFRFPKIIVENTTDSSTPKNISFDTPSVPTVNVRISVKPTEVATRTCTITSSSADSSEPTVKSSKAKNHANDKEVLWAKNGAAASETQPQPKPFKITIKNANAPSTSAAVGVEKAVVNSSIVVQNDSKRRRQDSDVILIDDVASKNNGPDDSVIFVSESINCARPVVPVSRKRKGGPIISFGSDFIPVGGAKRESPSAKMRKTKSTRAQRKTGKKMAKRVQKSRTEQPSGSVVAENIEPSNNNNNTSDQDPNKLEKRKIIIDGSNVAFK